MKGMHTPPMSLPDDPQPSLLTFPCVFPMKVMGRREDGFAQTVSEIVLRHADDFHPETIEMRSSKNGRYLSLTVTINARSREQLDALYSELSKHPMVMMVL
jgi:putative lipoic acid-binding regulatory protein